MLVPESALTLARIADAPAIAELSRTLIETGLPWSWVPRRVEASIRHPETNVVVARVREGIAGCTLLVYVDDATSRIVLARFVVSESTVSYMRATRDYVRQYGKPLAFYSDRHTVFSVNGGEKLSGNGVIQFCRALRQLGIELICALSSPAKGRVERAHLTLQDRLVKEMRLRGIATFEEGNAFLPGFSANRGLARFAKRWNAATISSRSSGESAAAWIDPLNIS